MGTGFICEEIRPKPRGYVKVPPRMVGAVCIVCGTGFTYTKVGAGRLRRFCSSDCEAAQRRAEKKGAYSEGRRRPLKPFTCAECGETFQSRQSKASYCKRCVVKASSRNARASRMVNTRTRRGRECQHCGLAFVLGGSTGRISRGAKSNEGKYCSKSCSHASRRVYASRKEAKEAARRRIAALLPQLPEAVDCQVCGQPFPPKSMRSRYCSKQCLYVAVDPVDRSPRQCMECATTFTPVYGDYRQGYCSKRCSKRHNGRITRNTRDARKRGLNAESVDPIEVFERDGWRCYICRVSTPRRLRGTIDPRAPELDHIIPLSAGGEHSYLNTACACRTCNQVKGASIFGQLRLFG